MASPAAEKYLATFSPEDQAAIRAGGDVDAWYQAAVAANSVPGQGTAAPASGWANATAAEAGINPWQQDYKQEFERTTGQALGNMSAEQRARWSMEHLDALDYRDRESAYQQWMAWQKHFDPKCPSSAPYQAEDGSGCVEKPDNSNKGYQQQAEMGGAGGAGGKGGGAGAVGTVANAGANDLQRQLEAQYAAKGGIFAPANQPGIRLNEGGLLWTDQPASTAPLGTPAPAGGRPRDRNRGNAPGGIMGGQDVDRSGGTALISATLNAFSPKAPSQAGTAPAPAPEVQASAWSPMPAPVQSPETGNQALVNSTTNQFLPAQNRRPSPRLAWWKGPQTA